MWIVLFGIKSSLADVWFACRLDGTAVSHSELLPVLVVVDA